MNDPANHSQADIHAAALTFAGKAQEALESATAAQWQRYLADGPTWS